MVAIKVEATPCCRRGEGLFPFHDVAHSFSKGSNGNVSPNKLRRLWGQLKVAPGRIWIAGAEIAWQRCENASQLMQLAPKALKTSSGHEGGGAISSSAAPLRKEEAEPALSKEEYDL